MAGHSFAALSLAVGYRRSDVGLRLSDGEVRWAAVPHVSKHARPERHDLLLDDVLEVRRPPVSLERILARVPLVEQERPGIVDLLVDREFEAARLGTAGLRVLPQQSCHR